MTTQHSSLQATLKNIDSSEGDIKRPVPEFPKQWEQGVEGVLAELDQAFFDIPFENSDYQNQMFVVAAQLTPARAYRALGLKMISKVRALKEAMFARKREEVEIRRIKDKISNSNTDPFDRELLQIDLEQKMDAKPWNDKLISDALHELDTLYALFKKFPKYTREQFEAEESLHYESRLNRQVSNIQGAHEALMNMNLDNDVLMGTLEEIQRLPQFDVLQLENILNTKLQDLKHDAMSAQQQAPQKQSQAIRLY